MDSAYVKQAVGNALSEALTQLILHGHSQSHPKLSSNLETNPYSTQEDPVSFVARYLLNYSECAAKCKSDDQEQEKINKIVDIIKQKKEAALAIQKAQEEKIALEAQEKLQESLQKEADAAQVPESVALQDPQAENATTISDQPPQNDAVAPEGEQLQESNA